MQRDPAFNDLITRAGTGVLLAVIALASIWAGGIWFQTLVALSCGLMVWEVARLCGPPGMAPVIGGILAAVFVALLARLDLFHGVAVVASLNVAFTMFITFRQRVTLLESQGFGWAQMILWTGLIAIALREGGGFVWMLWLILVVVVTDICGYFAGRLIGGPKFWPKVSPKKTWAGVVAGWIGAGFVGAIFIRPTTMGEGLILVSIFMSFASQMGDIAESALKRRAGVKDSSNLLPGHGGLLDRLDGVIGAVLVLGIIAALTNFPRAPI